MPFFSGLTANRWKGAPRAHGRLTRLYNYYSGKWPPVVQEKSTRLRKKDAGRNLGRGSMGRRSRLYTSIGAGFRGKVGEGRHIHQRLLLARPYELRQSQVARDQR